MNMQLRQPAKYSIGTEHLLLGLLREGEEVANVAKQRIR